jgi:uncharacterized protein (DUF362 family)
VTPFVNIRTVFDPGPRSIDALSRIYNDLGRLGEVIEDVAQPVLNDEKLAGKKILLKPNWVRHDRVPSDEICLRTHDSFLLATLTAVLKRQPKAVLIGDAPIQGCHWSKVVTPQLREKIASLEEAYSVPVSIKDFRRVTFDPALNDAKEDRRPMDDYLIFDVGSDSFLEPITEEGKNNFRVTVYNPDRFIESHTKGMHKYCITRDLFDADLVISLPKVKTHQKAGITAALKNIVGLNGDKDFLPHHRIGGTGRGGDCYPGDNRVRYLAELAYDEANRNKGGLLFSVWTRLAALLWRLSLPTQYDRPGAGWHGNDTTWRMVMDLNKIVHFGTADGRLASSKQRELYSLSDGIIAGQGDGPLSPDPLPLGVVGFTNSSALHDFCMAHLMGMRVGRLPLVGAAMEFMKSADQRISLNGEDGGIEDLMFHSMVAIMPPGWAGYEQG